MSAMLFFTTSVGESISRSIGQPKIEKRGDPMALKQMKMMMMMNKKQMMLQTATNIIAMMMKKKMKMKKMKYKMKKEKMKYKYGEYEGRNSKFID